MIGCGPTTLVTYGTCAFGATGSSKDCIDHVGNDDIRDLIRDSIARFSWQGKVGAAGRMMCDGRWVNWGLYHA